ncbi:hypothetical protein SS50377_20160 [Spironucleus salmonicida]|uniref:Uncharacterized protein n=1 Tax=Spironucleus salmonicida TaxID=348837 RepID=V6LNC6_9EUKA|nr:hypothetical protein SS50377_20160 [Spironucleus salmonicida]|eukprot:EST45216.1 Hypothetical protein SS50377_14788 [Spironucleus salmonicida]
MSRRQQIEILLRNAPQVYTSDFTSYDLCVNPQFDMNQDQNRQVSDQTIQPISQPTQQSNYQDINESQAYSNVILIQSLRAQGIDLIKAQQVAKLLDSLNQDQRRVLVQSLQEYI